MERSEMKNLKEYEGIVYRFFVVRLTAKLLRMTERSRIVILTRRRRGRISRTWKNGY